MPQFCFTITDGYSIPFHENMELPDLQTARAMAMRTSGEIISDLNAETRDDGSDWAMHMTDEAGLLVFVLRFSTTTSGHN